MPKYVTNPTTGRLIKVGGPTYNKLVDAGVSLGAEISRPAVTKHTTIKQRRQRAEMPVYHGARLPSTRDLPPHLKEACRSIERKRVFSPFSWLEFACPTERNTET